MIIKLNIDVLKIDKKRLFKGKKGTYANFTVLLRDETDQYGNDGMIVEDITAEEREAGNKGTILGNARIVQTQNKPDTKRDGRPHTEIVVPSGDDMDDCPF